MSAPRRLPVPEAVRAVLDGLRADGHEAVLVGGCVRELAAGRPVRDHDVATSASPQEVLARFPRAVPIGLRHGTVMVPTPAGPVDVTTWRGPDLPGDLARRDFTVNAMAWDPVDGVLTDPFGGQEDLRRGRLRAVGDAPARLGEDPLRALRAARLVAELGLAPDAALEAALPAAAARLGEVAVERIRPELERILVADHAEAALAWMQRTGLDAATVGRTAPEAPRRVAALPADLPLRLAAWLAHGPGAAPLPRLRFPRDRVQQIERLLAHHPVEQSVPPERPAAVRRLLARLGEPDLERLLRLREAELAGSAGPGDADARSALARLRETLARVRRQGRLALHRQDLALGGADVMAILGVPPGPVVGRALAHLTECVLEDPGCNVPEKLAERLRAWWADQPDGP
ncbi:MAG: hypothetical protein R3263_09375 [Myxococcota bacterium]|nr:hypothetical protein [Myxococcota bacterium]